MGNHMVSKNNFEPPKINAEIQRLSEWAKDSLAETVRHMSWFTICVLNPHFISYSPLISLVIGLVAEETNYFSETEKHPMVSIVLASLIYIPFIQTSSNSPSVTIYISPFVNSMKMI